ncbi:MAG: hypothetical protein OJF50_003527 [Nitrospira sp.]|nr:hypothetical protein [Nitrospira sp.]
MFGLNSNISPETSGHTVTTQISATLLSVGSTTGLNVP